MRSDCNKYSIETAADIVGMFSLERAEDIEARYAEAGSVRAQTSGDALHHMARSSGEEVPA